MAIITAGLLEFFLLLLHHAPYTDATLLMTKKAKQPFQSCSLPSLPHITSDHINSWHPPVVFASGAISDELIASITQVTSDDGTNCWRYSVCVKGLGSLIWRKWDPSLAAMALMEGLQMEDHTSDCHRAVPNFHGVKDRQLNSRTIDVVQCYRLGIPLVSVTKPFELCSRFISVELQTGIADFVRKGHGGRAGE
ncbi:hypothetical protein Tco_1556086 [Tanacetum coccineum]